MPAATSASAAIARGTSWLAREGSACRASGATTTRPDNRDRHSGRRFPDPRSGADGIGEEAALRAWVRARRPAGRRRPVAAHRARRAEGEPLALRMIARRRRRAARPVVGVRRHAGAPRRPAAGAYRSARESRRCSPTAPGSLVESYRKGRGEVIAVASRCPVRERCAGRGDDARLAYLLVRPGWPAACRVRRSDSRRHRREAGYQALTTGELLALAFAALAGLLWLAYGIVPLGPAHRMTPPREPTSEEFLDAVAALYGRARARDHAATRCSPTRGTRSNEPRARRRPARSPRASRPPRGHRRRRSRADRRRAPRPRDSRGDEDQDEHEPQRLARARRRLARGA